MRRAFDNVLDVRAVRDEFPALRRTLDGEPVAYFDGPGGSQVSRGAIRAMTDYMERGGANRHGPFASSVETEEMLAETRAAAADFLGARADEVAFGPNMTTLTYAVSRALAKGWDPSTTVVVTELDHRANVDPWLSAAEESGASVSWVPLDPKTLTLNLSDLERSIPEGTKLVACGLASNLCGTVTDLSRVAERAREVGALLAVDAVHAAPHLALDRDALGADVLTCSAYKFFGPHVGLTAIRRDLFDELEVYRLEPAPVHSPDKLESGTQNHEGIAGVGGALDFIASLGEGATLRERYASALASIESYEDALAGKLRANLSKRSDVTLYQAPDGSPKTPTLAFTLDGESPEQTARRLAGEGYFVASGDFYASTPVRRMGLEDGVVRVGLAPYTTEEEVEGLLNTL